MNKTDIIELVATEMDCSKVQAGKAVEAVIKSLREGILDDGGVTITGFGADDAGGQMGVPFKYTTPTPSLYAVVRLR